MAFKSVRLVKTLPARVTLVRFLPCVYAQVTLQVTWDCEAFVAEPADVGPLPRVDPLVHFQAVSSVKTFPAVFALKRANGTVKILVSLQELLQGKTFPTDVTGVRSLTCARVERELDSE